MENANFFIDAIDRFRQGECDNTRWDIAQDLVAGIGGTALNLGLIDTETSIPVWMRSTMSDEWLQSYVSDGHYLVDPFLPHLKNSMQMIEAKGGALSRSEAGSDALIGLNWGLKDAGYAYLAGLPFAGDAANQKRMITFVADEDPDEFSGQEFRSQLNCLSTVIAAFIGAPVEGDGAGERTLRFRSDILSERESQALRMLALGNKNTMIAWEMEVAEITVRKYFMSVRRKLGAKTREQAVAIAVQRGLISF